MPTFVIEIKKLLKKTSSRPMFFQQFKGQVLNELAMFSDTIICSIFASYISKEHLTFVSFANFLGLPIFLCAAAILWCVLSSKVTKSTAEVAISIFTLFSVMYIIIMICFCIFNDSFFTISYSKTYLIINIVYNIFFGYVALFLGYFTKFKINNNMSNIVLFATFFQIISNFLCMYLVSTDIRFVLITIFVLLSKIIIFSKIILINKIKFGFNITELIFFTRKLFHELKAETLTQTLSHLPAFLVSLIARQHTVPLSIEAAYHLGFRVNEITQRIQYAFQKIIIVYLAEIIGSEGKKIWKIRNLFVRNVIQLVTCLSSLLIILFSFYILRNLNICSLNELIVYYMCFIPGFLRSLTIGYLSIVRIKYGTKKIYKYRAITTVISLSFVLCFYMRGYYITSIVTGIIIHDIVFASILIIKQQKSS